MKDKIIYKAIRNTKKYILIIPIFSIIISYLTLQTPMYLKYAIDGLYYNQKDTIPGYITYFFNDNLFQNVIVIAIFLIATIILVAISTYIRNRVSFKFNLKINRNLKMEIFEHIEHLEYKEYYDADKDEMLQRIKDDADTYSNFFNTSLNLILDTLFFLIFMIKQSLELNITITIYILISVMVLIIFGIWYFFKLDEKVRELIQARKGLLSKTIECVGNFKMVKLLNKQNEEIDNYNKLNKKYTNSCINLVNLILFHEITTDHIQYLATPAILLMGGILVINGQITLGSLTVLITFAEKIMGYFISLGNDLENIDDFIVVNKLLNNLMQLEEEKEKDINVKLNGEILLIDVTIAKDGVVILRNINLQIKPGEKIAIVGENGSGKSILVKTLLGFYDYTGNIYINNINLKRISKKKIREYISLITEDEFIFSGTIYDNLCLYKEYPRETLDKATTKVDIYNEIISFKDGYGAYVGENGITLSGGQKQRIALARSLLKETKVLILDEAINKIDEITKARVLKQAIFNDNKTIIMVTHDFKILEIMPKIVFLHKGTSYVGTHEQLLKNKDYKNMITINEELI